MPTSTRVDHKMLTVKVFDQRFPASGAFQPVSFFTLFSSSVRPQKKEPEKRNDNKHPIRRLNYHGGLSLVYMEEQWQVGAHEDQGDGQLEKALPLFFSNARLASGAELATRHEPFCFFRGWQGRFLAIILDAEHLADAEDPNQ